MSKGYIHSCVSPSSQAVWEDERRLLRDWRFTYVLLPKEGGKPTSSSGSILSKKQAQKEEQRLISELQLTTEERNDLRDCLIHVTEGSTNNSPYFKPNPFYEKLKIKEKEVMSLVHNLEMEDTPIPGNFQELKKEMNFYHYLHNWLLMNQACMKKKLDKLKQENKEVQLDCALLQQYLVDLNLEDKTNKEKTRNLQSQQHLLSETAKELELNTCQEESLMKNELLSQEFLDDHNSEVIDFFG